MTKEALAATTENGGIRTPLMTFRFRVIFGGENFYDNAYILTQQVMNCSIDMKEKKFNIELRQSISPGIFTMLNIFIRDRYNIYIDPLDHHNDVGLFSIQLYDCECISHNFDLDYAGGSDVAKHKLVFSYRSLSEVEPTDWQAIADEVKNPEK